MTFWTRQEKRRFGINKGRGQRKGWDEEKKKTKSKAKTETMTKTTQKRRMRPRRG